MKFHRPFWALSVLALSLSLFSCSTRPEADAEGVVTIHVPDYPTSWEQGDTLFSSDLYTQQTYVPLVQQPDCALDIITRLLALPDHSLIVANGNMKTIARFDSLGHFLNTIGAIGHAGSEYVFPIDVAYDKYHNQVIVLDNPGFLYYYNIDGSFIRKVQIPCYDGGLNVLSPDLLLITNAEEAKNKYTLALYKQNGETVMRFMPIPAEQRRWNIAVDVVSHGERHFVRVDKSSDLLEVLPDTLLPAFHIALPEINSFMKGNIQKNQEYLERFGMTKRDDYDPNDYKMKVNDVQVVGDQLFIYLFDVVHNFLCTYNFVTGQAQLYSNYQNEFGPGPSVNWEVSNHYDKTVCHFFDPTFTQYVPEEEEESYPRKELLHHLDSLDTYVIELLQLK